MRAVLYQQEVVLMAITSRCLGGARTSDLFGLDWRGVNWDTRTIRLERQKTRPDSRKRIVQARELTPRERELLEGNETTKPVDFHSFRRAYVDGAVRARLNAQTAPRGFRGFGVARAARCGAAESREARQRRTKSSKCEKPGSVNFRA